MIRFDPNGGEERARASRELDATARFDEAAAWAGLAPEDQAQIGATALALAAAWAAQDEAETGEGRVFQTPLGRAAEQADTLAIDALVRLFDEVVPLGQRVTSKGQPRLPMLLGPVCRRCGCSELDACEEGCGWSTPDCCTACVESDDGRDLGRIVP